MGTPSGGIINGVAAGPTYLLRDEFRLAIAAPLPATFAASPGPGVWTPRDVETKIAIVPPWAEFTPQDTPVYAEQDLVCKNIPITRAEGVTLFGKFRVTTDGSFYPLALTSQTPAWNPTHVAAAFHRAATALSLTATCNATAGPIVATFVADGTVYYLAIRLLTSGAEFFIKGGVYTNWRLVWRNPNGIGATLYAALAGYSAAFGAGLVDVPLAVIANPALVNDAFNSLSSSWLQAGTWGVAGGVISNEPVMGPELIVNGNFTTWGGIPSIPSNYIVAQTPAASSVTENPSGQCQMVSDGTFLSLQQNILTSYRWYLRTIDIITAATGSVRVRVGTTETGLLYSTSGSKLFTARATNVGATITREAAPCNITIDNDSAKRLSISTLIILQKYLTPDIFAELIISALTTGTQMGIVQSDRSFAAKFGADYGIGDTVLALAGVTAAIPDTDTITVLHPVAGGITYTIASVGAWNEAAQTQTITLDAPGLVEAVSEDDPLGIDWASWNGVMCYHNGTNILVDEVKAGVYTNRGNTANTFAADKRFIVRKIGTEYRWFFDETLIASTTAIDAAAQVGMYWGMFSTYELNTAASIKVYPTGANNELAAMDRYAR